MPTFPILIDGQWREADAVSTFQAVNPASCEPIPGQYPLSSWSDCDAALCAATRAFDTLRTLAPDRIAAFLDAYAARIEARKKDLVAMAHAETALPAPTRLARIELPRTTNQLRPPPVTCSV